MGKPLIMTAIALGLAACGGSDPVEPEASETAGLPDINAVAPSAAGEPRNETAPARGIPAAGATIPAAFLGRWALAPGDCTAPPGEAKGLMTVTPKEIRFYESVAVPSGDVQTSADSVSGNFSFTGEGQSWTRFQALKVTRQIMVRTETNPSASFNYAKC